MSGALSGQTAPLLPTPISAATPLSQATSRYQRVRDMDSYLAMLASEIGEFDQRITALETRVTTIEARLAAAGIP